MKDDPSLLHSFTLHCVTFCTLNIGSPRSQCPKFAMNISARRFSLPVEAAALCGDTMTLGRSHSGESAGSGSCVCASSKAPASCPLRSASISARFVDDFAARDVDEPRAFAHALERVRVDAGCASPSSAGR